jgi:hypothetical protein
MTIFYLAARECLRRDKAQITISQPVGKFQSDS